MATCKLVKADGTLDLAYRRSFPSALDGFFRAVGLSKIFPSSKLFSKYNLTYMDADQKTEVQAINGAFMMAKMAAIKDVGFLHEGYFMYGADLDWCFRFRQKGWTVYYVPNTKVVQLKGQSVKKVSNIMLREFFRSMEIFCRKNYLPTQTHMKFLLTLAGIKIWKHITFVRNAMRLEKRVTP